ELRGASALAAGRERRRLERLAIENLLRAGQLDRGLGAAASLLRELGESLPTRPVVAFLTERARLRLRGLAFVSRAEGEVDELTLDRLDLLWSLASGLSFADPRLGVAMHSRMLRLALDAGEPRRIALALGMELGYVAIGGAAAGARLEEVRSRAAELARQLGQPDVDGFVALGSGAGAYLAGRFREGVAGLEAGASMMRQLSMSMRWQLDLADTLRVAALWWLGDLRRLAQVHAEGLRTADEGGSVDAQRHLRCWPGSVVPLMRGEPGESRAQIDAARPPRRPDERFHLHHYHALAGRAFVDLYEGQGGEAHRRVEEAWRHVERSGVMRVQIVAIEARYLRGAAAIAARGAAAANLALACAAQIDRFGVTHGRALAELLRGLVLAARDDHAAAAATLRSAVRHAEAADAGLFAAAARRRLGLLLGRDGAHLVTAADDWLRSQAVTDPARLAAMLVPPPAA
ncbi:MAG: hypothetical protein H6709_24940, partial [Kofleriaceae bacterium]|nr:hypothetical protein [Kofleriaceae bacterium]